MKTFFKIFSLLLLAQFAGSLALADSCTCGNQTPPPDATCLTCLALPACSWNGSQDKSKCSTDSGNGVGNTSIDLHSPLGDKITVPILIRNIINAALGIVGSLALLMFIYGGFTWMLAAGNEQAVEKGKNILTWATIGLIVIFASYSLVNFVIKAITQGG
jgi:hypothetical protein